MEILKRNIVYYAKTGMLCQKALMESIGAFMFQVRLLSQIATAILTMHPLVFSTALDAEMAISLLEALVSAVESQGVCPPAMTVLLTRCASDAPQGIALKAKAMDLVYV